MTHSIKNSVSWLLSTKHPISVWVYFSAFFIIFVTYLNQGLNLALTPDDITSMQTTGNHAIRIGRWATYLFDRYFWDRNPVPVFSVFLTSAILFATAFIASRILNLSNVFSIFAFLLLSSISVYYGDLFGYDMWRVQYSLAGFCATLGVYFLLRKHYILGIIFPIISAAFYQPGLQIAASILMAFTLKALIHENGYRVLRSFFIIAVGFIISFVIYEVTLYTYYYITTLTPLDIMNPNALSVFGKYNTLLYFTRNYLLPFSQDATLNPLRIDWMGYLSGLLFISFFLLSSFISFRKHGFTRVLLVILFNIALLFTPIYALFVIGGGGASLPFRSLFAVSMLQAIWLSFMVDIFATKAAIALLPKLSSLALISIGIVVFTGSAITINKFSENSNISTQSDILGTHHIISRIEDVISENGIAMEGPEEKIPLLVSISNNWLAYPLIYGGLNHDIDTGRLAPWSKEWIFRLIDNRFVAPHIYVRELTGREFIDTGEESAATKEAWPAADSVYMFERGFEGIIVRLIK